MGEVSVTAGARISGVATDSQNRERDDFYVTPDHAVSALLDRETFDGPIWEPACGDGAISRVLTDRGYGVVSTDLVDRGYGVPRVDFLMEYRASAPNIVTNPPYKLSTEFARHALDIAVGKVALLCRVQFLEGIERRGLFSEHRPTRVWVFSERLTMWRSGVKASDSGGTNCFIWVVWDKAHTGPTELGWI